MIKQWHFVMLSEDGDPVFLAEEELPPRPQDAQPDNGDPFTPWYQKESHAHYDENGSFEGVHFFGTEEDALVFFSLAIGAVCPLQEGPYGHPHGHLRASLIDYLSTRSWSNDLLFEAVAHYEAEDLDDLQGMFMAALKGRQALWRYLFPNEGITDEIVDKLSPDE